MLTTICPEIDSLAGQISTLTARMGQLLEDIVTTDSPTTGGPDTVERLAEVPEWPPS
ncbi:hypothetical protein GCM10027403_09770 [Arthrobacter tecti]